MGSGGEGWKELSHVKGNRRLRKAIADVTEASESCAALAGYLDPSASRGMRQENHWQPHTVVTGHSFTASNVKTA